MYLSTHEAMALLERWKNTSTPLQVSLNRSGEVLKVQASVSHLNAGSVTLACAEREIELDLSRAEFNGDAKEHPKSSYGAYLVCEYRSGDTCYLYAPRSEEAVA